MNKDEELAKKYLVFEGFRNIKFEPDGNIPPDFLCDSNIAVEVRRLNKFINYSDTQKPIEEMNRKIRIVSREWFALFRHVQLLNPITNFNNSLFLFSHKLIRWLLPIWSLCILISNIFLFNQSIYFKAFLFIQIGVIVLGLIEVILEKNKLSFKLFKLPAYLIIMNYASAVALIKVLKGEQQKTWDTIRS